MYNYLKEFAKKNGIPKHKINIFKLLDLSYPKNYSDVLSYYTDPKQWSPLDTYIKCYLKVREITKDPDVFRKCGRSCIKYKSIDQWRVFVKSLSGPKAAMEYMPHAFSDWNRTKKCEFIDPPRYSIQDKRVKTIMKITFDPDIEPCDDYCSDPHILGILEAMPTNWPKHLWSPWKKLPFGKVNQTMVQYDPIKLYNGIFFNHLKLEPEIINNRLYISHPETKKRHRIGESVILTTSEINGKKVYTGTYVELTESRDKDDQIGILITETIEHKGESICQKDTIMKAPYFCLEYSFEDLFINQYFRSVKNVLSGNKLLRDEILRTNQKIQAEVNEKNKAYHELESYSEKLEEMVEDRTKELKETQAQLIESEKRSLEHQITGGFAHEMRNALAGAQLEFKNALNYQGQNKTSAAVLKESALKILKKISEIHEEYNIPKETIASDFIPELKTIAEISETLSNIHTGVSRDIDRGLAITSQIRDYARMSEMKKGENSIDIIKLLKDYKVQYKTEFEKHGIKYSVDGPDQVVVKADEIHLNSIFSNLILNAKDALAECGKDQPEIKIGVEVVQDQFNISIQDNGPGIKEENLKEIFEPFFSTKPTTGTGLGLGIVKKLVQLYGGKIKVESKIGVGTTFIVTLPEKTNG